MKCHMYSHIHHAVLCIFAYENNRSYFHFYTFYPLSYRNCGRMHYLIWPGVSRSYRAPCKWRSKNYILHSTKVGDVISVQWSTEIFYWIEVIFPSFAPEAALLGFWGYILRKVTHICFALILWLRAGQNGSF